MKHAAALLVRAWQIADVQSSKRDVDVNGTIDLILHEVDQKPAFMEAGAAYIGIGGI